MKNILRELKWAYQRVFKGYDDRVFWDLDVYFLRIIPALKIWCKEELKGTATIELNPSRHEVFTETIRLIEDWEKMSVTEQFNNVNQESRLLEYIGKNIGYFWD